MSKDISEIQDRLEHLASGHEAIPHMLRLIGISSDPEADFKAFLVHVDESNHSLTEWLDAVQIFYEFNEEIDFEFNTMVGYISCSAEAAQSDIIHFKLPDLLSDFLEEYGFENLSA